MSDNLLEHLTGWADIFETEDGILALQDDETPLVETLRLARRHIEQLEILAAKRGAALTRTLKSRERAQNQIEQLTELLQNLTCPNCDDRHCMDCVMRYVHDTCVDDCPQCCADKPNLHLSKPVEPWRSRKEWLERLR